MFGLNEIKEGGCGGEGANKKASSSRKVSYKPQGRENKIKGARSLVMYVYRLYFLISGKTDCMFSFPPGGGGF